MPAQTARKLNTSGAHAPIVNREVHLHPSLNNGCILRVQRVHRYHSTKFERLHCITDWTGIESEIIGHIRNFIQCLGPGFCFVGNQHRIEVGGDEFYADLLFFQRDLKAQVVIELKKGKFKPAYLG